METLLAALRAASETTRLRILALCQHGEVTVGDLVRILGQSQPRVSRHLKLLTEAGLLERLPEGSQVFHRIARHGVGADVVKHLASLLPAGDPALARDLDRLVQVKRERAEKAAEYFRRNAQCWDELRTLHVDDGDVEAAITRLLPAKGLGELLDIGTGTGRLLELYGPEIGAGLGVDTSREMLRVARANLDGAGLGNCHVRQGDMYQLPFDAEGFDAALIHQVLHFADDPGLVIDEAARVLRPGGRLLIADCARHGIEALRRDHAHRRLGFTDDEVTGWLSDSGLTMTKTRRLKGDPLTVVLWLAEKPRHQEDSDSLSLAPHAAPH